MPSREEPVCPTGSPQSGGGFGFVRQGLLEAPLQVLHVGRAGPGDDGRPPPLPAGPVQLAHFLAEMLKHIADVFIVFAGGDFEEQAAQLVGQLDAVIGLHLPGMQEVPLVAHDDNGGLRVRVDLPDVLVQGADGLVALVVCDGVDQQEALCPLHALGQGVDHLRQAVWDLRKGSRKPSRGRGLQITLLNAVFRCHPAYAEEAFDGERADVRVSSLPAWVIL